MATPEGPKTQDEPVAAPEPRGTRAPAWLMLLVVFALVAATIAFASWVDTDPTMVGPALGPAGKGTGAGEPATGSASPSTSSVVATSTDPAAGTPSATTTP